MAGRPYVLAETNWKDVRETEYDVAILPWGATEAHNYHLPYSTDVVQCDEIAAEAAKRAWAQGARPIVLPTVPFGVNTGQLDVKLDINMNPSTQLAVLSDVVAALEHQGINRLLVMNGHGGNDFRQMVRELLPQHSRYLSAVWTGFPSWKKGFLSGEETMQMRWRQASCSICVPSGSYPLSRPVMAERMRLK